MAPARSARKNSAGLSVTWQPFPVNLSYLQLPGAARSPRRTPLRRANAFGLQQPLDRARVVVTFTHRSRRYMGDVDNLYSRSKCLVDALKGILLVDDSPAHLELDVRQQLGKERSVCLEVWPAGQEQAA